MKYLVLYCAPSDILKRDVEPTPEQMKEGMKPWMEWADKCGSSLIDLGNPLVNAIQINHDNSLSQGEREVAGYSILEVNSKEDALELLKDHPHLIWNDKCQIELLEISPLA